MDFLKKLEKKIEGAMKRLPIGPGEQWEPLELKRAILEEVEGKITSLGGGRRVFPFNHLNVMLHASGAERRVLYEVAFVNDDALANAVRERLSEPRCERPASLDVVVELVDEAEQHWAAAGYQVIFERRTAAAPTRKGKGKARAQLVVIQGEAESMKYGITKKRTNIGRQTEVLDKDGLPLRRNDLVFLEERGEVNQTVSRIHAHIDYHRETGEFRLHDDNSAYGTFIIRSSGRRVKVTRSLGAPLRSGDEIFFGQARVLFKNE
jgi:hypothetical protein